MNIPDAGVNTREPMGTRKRVIYFDHASFGGDFPCAAPITSFSPEEKKKSRAAKLMRYLFRGRGGRGVKKRKHSWNVQVCVQP